MEKTILTVLEGLVLKEVQTYRNLAVFPLFTTVPGPDCLTLREALARHLVAVHEVSEGGSVPELEAENKGDWPVLLLDGEELAGAKQNRVLNTTLLLSPHSRLRIPVSCTEQGRWSSVSREFRDSGYVMSPRIRSKKVDSVSQSLKEERGYRSDQRQVWDEVHKLSEESFVSSPTGAMRDTLIAKEVDLEEALRAFPCLDGQKGLLVLLNGRVAGFDLLPSLGVYSQLHAKLAKSYAMDALLEKEQAAGASKEMALAFLKEAVFALEETFPSVGMGLDHRFSGPALAGSALSVGEKVAHMAFFRLEGMAEKAGSMASMRKRRSYRNQG
ncbi:MAG: hypothetical protein NTV14_07145 [Coprothermobacterota bacterium]|nr:hypothetical protein [Coprothermobacterota bacterium]